MGLNNRFFKKAKWLFFVALIIPVAHSEIYKWTDENGKTHFSDSAPEDKVVEALDLQVNTYEHVSVEAIFPSLLDDENKGEHNNKKPKVIMYSTEWCGVCKRAKKYFKSNKITYKEYDIEKNDKAKRRFKKLGGKGVPLIRVGRKKMMGFSASRFEKLFKGQSRK